MIITEAVGRRLVLPGQFVDPVTVESAEDLGPVVALRVRTLRGEPKEAMIAREELIQALAQDAPSPTAFAPSAEHALLVESHRIRLAYAFDPYFAVSLSGIEPLPHQLEAVYERMLPQARLRFLLADDPGAGKTIMAGLLLKELKLRGAVERTLILAPAPLTLQWQDELRQKFDEVFERIDSSLARDQLGGSPWQRFPQCVASIDFAKQTHIADDLLRERWDLVIVDEAHKVAVADTSHPTERFKLMRPLTEKCERLLLLTATPHQGHAEQFQNLLSLLDEDAFSSAGAVTRLLASPDNPWMLRRMKEDLRDFDGKPLFVDRKAYTEQFQLDPAEWALYELVTAYVNTYLPRQKGRRMQSAALARMVLQRRLASSLYAIRISLERRYERLGAMLDELNTLPPKERDRRLRELADIPQADDTEVDSDDAEDETLERAAVEACLAERFENLVMEVAELNKLVQYARAAEVSGTESKLRKLFEVLEYAQFDELKEAGGKLLIFTEHKATLDYLDQKLRARGYATCTIHGGMDAVTRKAVQADFKADKQICIATDAAGEGINLQFCHLMINYDLPWNPNRLEQRMGRIHRFRQERECHIFNFVAVSGPEPATQQVVEGVVMARLLMKLNLIRQSLGDRIFDVIGTFLQVQKMPLEEVLREASANPKLLDSYLDRIEKLSPEKLIQFEKATGIALARRTVDLKRIRGADWESEEKRLMPEFVEDYFVEAAKKTGLRIERRANPKLLRIETVPQKFLARHLASASRYGNPARSYPKATFHKNELKKTDNMDGELVSPGHPLYAAVDEVLQLSLREHVGRTSRFIDPLAATPYRLHFYEVELEGESLGDPSQPARVVPVFATLVAVEERDSVLALAKADHLHDLVEVVRESEFLPALVPLDVAGLGKVTSWVRARVQFPAMQDKKSEREREVVIRRDFLQKSFDASILAAQRSHVDLMRRFQMGEREVALARDQAQARVKELQQTREHRLRALDHLAIVRAGRVAHLASMIVEPPHVEGGMKRPMVSDPAVELAAIRIAIEHEEAAGRRVEEVWRQHDSSGFDLRSVSADGREVRRIEVKGRSGTDGEVMLTPNEWRCAERLRSTYWLYVVWAADSERPALKTIPDPWTTLRSAAQEVIALKGYRLPVEALRNAPGETFTENGRDDKGGAA